MPPPLAAFAEALVLTGPTGSGKSTLAIDLAEKLGAEIVSMDSMTLYRQLDIGTAKPTQADRARVPHHMLDVLDPWESANVVWWLDQAATLCLDIRARNRRPLFVGGTPFYLKALLYGLFEAPPVDRALRQQLEAEAEQLGSLPFHAKLAKVDPRAAARLHPNDVRRVVRALEVWHSTGRPLSEQQQNWNEDPLPIPCVVLEWPREELARRIDLRVLSMIDAGWLDEVRGLKSLPRPLSAEASQALGYRELLAFLDGAGPSWNQTVSTIQMRTRQFAKRQRTWFRGLSVCRPCQADEPGLVDRVTASWSEQSLAFASVKT